MSDPRFVGVLNLVSKASPYAGSGGTMEVKDDFSFIDSRGIIWTAHKGDVIDGASIPRLFKLIIGGSFQSSYLPAAVLHDVYCTNQSRSQQSTSRMFREALETNGVNRIKAYAMWFAVYRFGPQWSTK